MPAFLLFDTYNRIIPVLLKCMVYSDDEIMLLELAAERDARLADRQQDLKPRFHKLKNKHEGLAPVEKKEESDSESDYEEDFDESNDEWNLRKCCAAALDCLCTCIS